MKKSLVRCAALAAALVLLLSACGQPARVKTLAERYADGELLYVDIGYPAGFAATPENRLALENAVKTRLGYPENLLFRYAEIGGELPEDWAQNGPEVLLGVKPGEAALDLDDPAQLAVAANSIADGLIGSFGLGAPPTAAADPATKAPTQPPTTPPTVPPQPSTNTTGTTTTKAPTTTTKKPETTRKKEVSYPQELRLPKNQIASPNNVSQGDRAYRRFETYSDSGFNLPFSANGKTYMISRDAYYHSEDYLKNHFKDGAVEKLGLFVKTGQNGGQDVFRQLDTLNYTVREPGSSPPGYQVFVIFNLNDFITTNGTDPSYRGIRLGVGNNIGADNSYSSNGIDGDDFGYYIDPSIIKNAIRLYNYN